MDENFYEILGVKPDDDSDSMRKTINQKIRQVQANLNSLDNKIRREAEEQMQRLLSARKVLLDPQNRKEYDSSLKKVEPVKLGTFPPVIKSQSSVLILFDATGSMAPLWDETAKVMEEIVRRITEVGNVSLKCCAYRDYCDGDRIFEHSEWSTRAEPLLKFIGQVKCDGGGDFPEAVEVALKHSEDDDKATRIVLIGDAPPHADKDHKLRAANLGQKDRPVFAFRVGNAPETESAFKEIAKLSGGNYADLKDYKDLMDLMAITAVHDLGGLIAVKEYTERHKVSEDTKKFAKSLPSKI
jgi:curved DNA-binding protein CbpA